MAPGNKGSQSDKGSEDGADGAGGPYAQATEEPDWDTACISGSDGTTWNLHVAVSMLNPLEPHKLHVELARATVLSSPPSQDVSDVDSGGMLFQRGKKKKKTEKNSLSLAHVASSSTGKADSAQHAPTSSSKTTNSTGRTQPLKKARTTHPGEPPPTAANTCSANPLAVSLHSASHGENALPAVSLRLPYLLVERYDSTPAPFIYPYGHDPEAMTQREDDDSDLCSPSRQLLGSDANELDFTSKFASSPNSFALKRFQMLSESDSAYFSNLMD